MEESFWNLSLWQQLAVAILTIASAYGLFKLEQYYKRKDSKEDHKSHLVYIRSLILDVHSFSRKQKINLFEFSDKLNREPYKMHEIKIYANKNYKRLLNCNNERTFESLGISSNFRPLRNDYYNQIFNHLDLLDSLFDSTISFYEKYERDFLTRQLSIKKRIEEISDDLGFFCMEIKGENPQYVNSPEYQIYNTLLARYREVNTAQSSLNHFVHYFLNPLREALFNSGLFNSRVYGTIRKCKECIVEYSDLTRVSTFYSRQLREIGQQFEDFHLSYIRPETIDGILNGT